MPRPTSIPTHRQIAEALGISPGRVSQLKAQGMPTDTITAARAWRAANLHPGRMKLQQAPATEAAAQAPSAASVAAQALADEVGAILERGECIDALVPPLRSALHAVPWGERDVIALSPALWRRLLVHAVPELADPHPSSHAVPELAGTPPPADLSPHEEAVMNDAFYCIAAGEIGMEAAP